MKFLPFLLFCFSLNSFSQWERTGEMETPINAEQILEYNGIYFLTCQENYGPHIENKKTTFVSYDTLETWQPFTLGPIHLALVFNDTIYAIMQEPGTTESYQLQEIYLNGDDLEKNEIAYAPNPVQHLEYYVYNTFEFYEKNEKLWLVSEGGLYSFDEGVWTSPTWYSEANYPTQVDDYGIDEFGDPITSRTPWCKSADQNSEYVFATSYQGIVRSEPTETFNWTILDNGIPADKSSSIITNDAHVFASIKNEIYRSTDNGDSWGLAYGLTEGNFVNDFFIHNDSIFALSSNGIYLSPDNGITWIEKNTGLLAQTNVKNMIYSMGDYLIATTNGLYSNLENWERVDDIHNTTISQIENNSNVLMAKASKRYRKTDDWGWFDAENYDHLFSFEDQLFTSENMGDSWTNVTIDLPINRTSEVALIGNQFFMIGSPAEEAPENQLVYSSDDMGENWEEIATLPNNGMQYELRSNGENILVAFAHRDKWGEILSSDYSLFVSTDAGITWNESLSAADLYGIDSNFFNDVLVVGDDIYLIVAGHLFKSADFGLTWYASGEDLHGSDRRLNRLFLNAFLDEVYAPYGIQDYPADFHFLKSETWGESWIQTESFGQNGFIIDMDNTTSESYACTNKKVYFSADGAATWDNYSFGLPTDRFNEAQISSLLLNDGILYFGTNNNGVWKITIADILLGIDPISEIEMCAYPNPFNGVTTINFGQDYQANHTVLIYDLSGKEIYRKENVIGSQLQISKQELGTGVCMLLILDEELMPVSTLKLVVQ